MNLIEAIPPLARGFLLCNAGFLSRRAGCDFSEAMAAGVLAFYQCVKDGTADADGQRITKGAKRFVRREMLRAAAKSDRPEYTSMPDFGYADGRTVTRRGKTRVLAKNKFQRLRHKYIANGLCRICGRKPEDEDFVLCHRCRRVKRAQYLRRQIARGQQSARKLCQADLAVLLEFEKVGGD